MTISIRLSIDVLELGLTLDVPPDMLIRAGEYVESNSEDDVYYIAESYGDLWNSSADDIRISGAGIGDLGGLLENVVFTQEVDLDWRLILTDGTRCSGQVEGLPIEDFETATMFLSPFNHLEW
jgi:hypothetical protein